LSSFGPRQSFPLNFTLSGKRSVSCPFGQQSVRRCRPIPDQVAADVPIGHTPPPNAKQNTPNKNGVPLSSFR
ncbi:hypothetical protein, partial [Pelagicoccus mobilis]